MNRLALAALAVTAATAACKSHRIDDIKFDRHETQAGFEIDLPAGKVMRKTIGPASGEIMIQARPAVIVVAWQTGAMPPEDLKTFGRAAMSALSSEISDDKFEDL